MRIRLSGPPAEVATVADLVRTIVTVSSMSRDYPSGGGWVRRYIVVGLIGETDEEHDPTAPRCPWCRLPFVLDQQGPAMGGMSWSCRHCERMFVHAEAGVFLAPAEDVATIQIGDWVLLPAGWRVALDVRVTADEVQVRTDVPTDPLTGFRLKRVLTRREVKPWHDGSTFTHRVHVVRAGQEATE